MSAANEVSTKGYIHTFAPLFVCLCVCASLTLMNIMKMMSLTFPTFSVAHAVRCERLQQQHLQIVGCCCCHLICRLTDF